MGLTKNKVAKEMLADIKNNLPNKKLSITGGLGILNGLLIVYKKAIGDYSEGDEVAFSTALKDAILEMYEAKEKDEKCEFVYLDKYCELLPKSLASMIDFDIFKGEKVSKSSLNNQISNLCIRVLEQAVKIGLRERENNQIGGDKLFAAKDKLQMCQMYYQRHKGFGLNLRDEDKIEVENYLFLLAKELIDEEVDYSISLAEGITRFYSNIVLERQAESQRQSYNDDEDAISI